MNGAKRLAKNLFHLTYSSRQVRAVSRAAAGALLLASFLLAGAAEAQDAVPVPGGPASVRRLMGLDSGRPDAAFFVDLHEVLLFSSSEKGSWSKVEGRRRLVDFSDDLREWRADFGSPAVFAVAPKDQWRRTERALEWLGFKVRGSGQEFTTQRRQDEESARRQGFLDVIGTPLASFLEKLHAGETVRVAVPDGTAPLPFGLAAWRETLSESDLSAANAFLFFVKNVKASRMLVALNALDPETREALRTLLRDEKGRHLGWAMLYEDTLEPFSRYPEALMLRNGRFVLPGGTDADPIWTDIVGVPPSDVARFLPALFDEDGGKAAYVVDTLQHLPDASVRELLFGRTGGGQKAVKRFHRLYKSFDRAADNYELTMRDPYDFAQLAPFLRLSDEGTLMLPVVDADGDFPENEAELSEVVARARNKAMAPEESLRRLFRRDTTGKAGSFPGQRRFLFASNLVEQNPGLSDPGLLILLYRGLDKFLPAYAPLEDLPLDKPDLARKYLFALDRLDRRSDSREKEVAIGLFQADVELLARLYRSGSLPPEVCRALFADLLAVPLFAQEGVSPGASEEALYKWLSRLLQTLGEQEKRLIEARTAERQRREEEYRDALVRRDERILARLDARRASEEARRAAAEARLAEALGPQCGPDDEAIGPPAPVYLLEEQGIAESLFPDDPPAGETLASQWMEETLDVERARAAPLPRASAPPREAGELPGSTTIAGDPEPMPRLIRIDVPEPSPDADELLSRAIIGAPETAYFEWRGGRYRFDPASDAAARRRAFRHKQRLAWLVDLEALHRSRESALGAAARGDLAGAKKGTAEEASLLRIAPSKDTTKGGREDERVLKEEARARDAAQDISEISKPGRLLKVADWMPPVDAMLAERHLEAVLGHVYAASAENPDDLYYEDPDFVRHHSFRTVEKGGRVVQSAFMKTAVVTGAEGKGAHVAGSLFGLPDVLGLLHADQLAYAPGAGVPVEEIRTGLVAPVWRVEAARLDDDALRAVAASCQAAGELASAMASRSPSERFAAWDALGRDLVPRARLGLVASLDGATAAEEASAYLTPSDRYEIGRRLAESNGGTADAPRVPAAEDARSSLEAMTKRYGVAGARMRLAEFGPRPVSYAGSFRLSDMDMPPYERLAAYRFPQILSDRLYDLKIVVACRLADERLPAALVPLVLPAALDAMLTRLKMAYPYDWPATVRAASRFSREDLDHLLDEAVRAGRITRDEGLAATGGTQ
jgi:hypothetical protein